MSHTSTIVPSTGIQSLKINEHQWEVVVETFSVLTGELAILKVVKGGVNCTCFLLTSYRASEYTSEP